MKSKNLDTLKKNHINVPDFIVLPYEALIKESDELKKLYETIDFSSHTKGESGDLKSVSLQLKDALKKSFTWQNDLLESKNHSLFKNDTSRYAVRSSCNVEDGTKTSFAGHFDTSLNVLKQDIKSNVLKCLASMYNTNVIEYVHINHLNLTPNNSKYDDSKNTLMNIKMDVIIQEMVDADYSGILFTSNPQGIINESVIVVGEGLGEDIVSDKVDTTTYYYNTTDNNYYYDGQKEFLSESILLDLLNISNKIKEILHQEYLDIEFSIKDNMIYILQARPITTIDDSNLLILDNSNIVESYPGVSLPLTVSFANIIYSGVFKGVASRVLKNDRVLEYYNHVFSNMVGSSNGRMYYKISNWYTLIKFLPMSHKIIPVWQDMLGVKNKNYNNEKVSISIINRILTYIYSVYEIVKVPSAMKKLNENFLVINEFFYTTYYEGITNQELVELFNEIKDKLLSIWDITLLNDMYAFIFTGLLKSKLKKKYPNQYEEKSIAIISGISNIESMKPIQELIDLSYKSLKGKTSKEYQDLYLRYLRLYGDRSMEELKLESETFRTNPKLLDEKIAEYTIDPNKLEEMRQSVYRQSHHKLKGNGLLYHIYGKQAMKGIENREISRMNRSRIFGMVRAIFISFGKNFAKDDWIVTWEDIFYLEIDEILKVINDPLGLNDKNQTQHNDLKALIEKRKLAYQKYRLLPTYSRLIFTHKEFNKNNKHINAHKYHINKNNLQGIPCSNGKVTGEVLVIHNPKEVKNAKNKILVTKMTDPGWVFLLANAKGIIAEKGSLLSHTAIISRELNIPSIVGVDQVLDILKTGDIVTMDGSSGMIEIKR